MPSLNFPVAQNSFTSYDIDERSFTLSEYQQAVIQNQIAFSAQQQLNLRFNPVAPADFGIEHARLVGVQEALQYLLDLSSSNTTLQLVQEK